MVPQTTLRAVGYWRPNQGWDDLWAVSDLPDPRWLVRRSWRLKERAKIFAYLRSGHKYEGYAGYSYCRFLLCWVRPRVMGDWDLTDGEWVWPQGLAHYFRRHSVCLPDEFVDTMRINSWQVPPDISRPPPEEEGMNYDQSFWVAWARREQRRPWYVAW